MKRAKAAFWVVVAIAFWAYTLAGAYKTGRGTLAQNQQTTIEQRQHYMILGDIIDQLSDSLALCEDHHVVLPGDTMLKRTD